MVTSPELPLKTRLEIERVNLLYQQNISGIVALFIFGAAYIYISWTSTNWIFLAVWGGVLFLSGFARVLATLSWRKALPSLTKTSELKRWQYYVKGALLTSGLAWGTIAWMMPYATYVQQIMTCLVVIMMAAGGVVAYCSSFMAMLLVFIPSMSMWAVSLLITGDPIYQMIAGILVVYIGLGIYSGRTLNRYVLDSIRLTLENNMLANSLKTQQTRLQMALESAAALTWTWNMKTDEFVCYGNIPYLLGMSSHSWHTTFAEYLNKVHPEDRLYLREKMRQSTNGEFEFEYRLLHPSGEIRNVTQRGKVLSEKGKPTSLVTGVCLDVTAKKSQEVLRKEISLHEAENKAKSALLANVSHEIRTPLAAINGFTEMLLQNPGLKKEMRQDLQMISRNGKYLVSLVNDLLDLSKMESDQVYLQKTQMAVLSEIEDIVQMMAPMVQSKGLDLQIVFDTKIPTHIHTDITRFSEVVINLLTNAIKYTEKGKVLLRVSFEQKKDDGLLRLRVIDTGIGVSDESKFRLFMPFARGLSPAVQSVQGAGLGLALSRKLARLMGGDVTLVKSEEGVGSEFEFTLSTGPISPLELEEPAPSLKDKDILVVDDSVDLQELMQRVLETRGAHVHTLNNGAEAVEHLKDHHYDVVLMDIKMPVMDGYTAAGILRRSGYTGPLVAVTAHASADDRQLCYDSGFDSYISKPVDFKHLIEEVPRLMATAYQTSS